jgi:hypothetical protein
MLDGSKRNGLEEHRKDKCISHLKVERMPIYKWSRIKPKWKVLKGSKAKTQAQVKGKGEKAKKELKHLTC